MARWVIHVAVAGHVRGSLTAAERSSRPRLAGVQTRFLAGIRRLGSSCSVCTRCSLRAGFGVNGEGLRLVNKKVSVRIDFLVAEDLHDRVVRRHLAYHAA